MVSGFQTKGQGRISPCSYCHVTLAYDDHAHLMSKSAQGAEPPAVLQPEDLQGGGDDHFLLMVIWRGDTFECLQALESILAALSLESGHS